MKYWALFGLVILAASLNTIWANDDDDDDDDDSTEFGNLKVPGDRTTTCKCGWANKEDQRIVGGEETKVNEYPMMAGLYYKPKKILFCGGTVITKLHVITAAHCTEPFEESVKDLQIVLGEHDQDKVDESSHTQYHDVEGYTEHPKYYLVGHHHDISIIKLKEKIQFNDFIGPACMPIINQTLEKERVKVLGWGKLTAKGPASKVLMKVYLNVVSLKKCMSVYEEIGPEERQLCTQHPSKDACQGDSGGPLLHLNKEINRYELVGLVSFGEGCATGNPAVNTLVQYYMPWIREVIKDAEMCFMK